MATYLVQDGCNEHHVTVVSDVGDEALVRIGDRELSLRLKTLPDGTLAVDVDGRVRRFRSFEDQTGTWLCEGPKQRNFQVIDERESWLGLGKADGAASSGQISASMPGRVVKVTVSEGDAVEAGTIVAVLEAMKMENDVKTPVAGVVGAVSVSAGDVVETGQLLVRVDAPT